MNLVLRGDAQALSAHARRLAASSPALLLPCRPSTRGLWDRCWNGARSLIEELRSRRGDAAIDAVLARHRPAASCVPGLFDTAELDPGERCERRALAAVQESHLSHNLLVQAPLFTAWADLLADLLAGEDGPLVVEELSRLDRESLAALRALYRVHPDAAPPLVAGFDPTRRPAEPDADGLLWDDPNQDALRVALAFAALDGGRVDDLGRGSDDPAPPPRLEVEKSAGEVSAVDERALAILRTRRPLGADSRLVAVEAVRQSFACFSFTTALRLGLELLAAGPALSAEERADVHGIVALAAHNRQFRSDGNQALARFLEHHLERALAAEERPARRSCLCYRLAVTRGRRRKDFAAGCTWAARAIEEAREAPVPAWQRAHLEAWGRNIRAYALMGQRRLDDATADCEAAFVLLDRVLAERSGPALDDPDPLVRETAYTHSLLADNLAALAKLHHDEAGFARWKTVADEIAVAVPGLTRFEAILWIDLHRAAGHPDLALPRAEAGREAARREQDPLREYSYTVQMADLVDRLGDPERSLELYREAIALRQRLGDPEVLRPLQPIAAMVALRHGDAAAAQTLIDDALAAAADDAARAQLLARRGRVFAVLSEATLAEQDLNRAIDLASADGHRDVLLDVAILAAGAARQLGRDEEAREALTRALEIAEVDDASEENTPPPAALLFAAELGLAELGEAPRERLIRALRLLPKALEDTETWWMLNRLLAALGDRVGTDGFRQDEGLARALDLLRQAASLRPEAGATDEASGG